MIDLEQITKNKNRNITTVVLSVFGAALLTISVGFSALNQNLNVAGEIDYLEYTNNLHDVIVNNPDTNDYIEENTSGSDSLDPDAPSEPIYYYEGTGDKEALDIMRNNNVLFADHCWKIVRTTSTGGTKLLYNGRAENNQCLKERSNAIGYKVATKKTVNTTYYYYYATDYSYDVESKLFSLTGTVNSYLWDGNNISDIKGKYTCYSTVETNTCSTINLVVDNAGNNAQLILPITSNSVPSQFGKTQYNMDSESLSSVGYMYGNKYISNNKYVNETATFTGSNVSLFNSYTGGTNYWYSDEIELDNTGQWKLINPFKIESTSEYSTIVGKYSLRSTNANATSSTAEYMVGYSGNTFYYYWIRGSVPKKTLLIGSNISDLGNGNYQLTNTQQVDFVDWYANPNNYIGYFICDGEVNTCSQPRYIGKVAKTTYAYVNIDQKILIAKNRSGTNLQNTALIYKYQLLKNPNIYSDYKYTCNSESSTCAQTSQRMITTITESGYTYVPLYFFGKSVTWDGTSYHLVNTIEVEDYLDFDKLSTHHYFCLTPGEKDCSEVGFIYRATDYPRYYYIILSNGTESIDDAINEMIRNNENSSIIKMAMEYWYKKYLLPYDNFIEDTIFCNDRTIQDLGGWSETGDITTSLTFKTITDQTPLTCPSIYDKFSVGNTQAKTNYKVGVLTYQEYLIQDVITEEDNSYAYFWTNSPHSFTTNALMNSLTMAGVGGTYGVYARILSGKTRSPTSENSIRPSISLKSTTEYIGGTGALDNPYVVNMGD